MWICCEKREEKVAVHFFQVERVEKEVWKRENSVEKRMIYVNSRNREALHFLLEVRDDILHGGLEGGVPLHHFLHLFI